MKGYLEVKIPAGVRGKGIRAWKAWKRRWVVVHGLTHASTQHPMATMDVYSRESQGEPVERTTIYLEAVTVIRRTRSRSRRYAFGVESDRALVYLSGYSETDSQRWMSALRRLLRPSTSEPFIDCCIGHVYGVSLVEPLSRTAAAVASDPPIGFVITLPSVALLATATTGCICAEWPWHRVAHVALAPAANDEDRGKVMVVEISGAPKSGLYYFFCERARDMYETFRAHLHPGLPLDSGSASGADDRREWAPPDADSDPGSTSSADDARPVAASDFPLANEPLLPTDPGCSDLGKSYNVSLDRFPKDEKRPSGPRPSVPPLATTRKKSCSDSALVDPKGAYGGDPARCGTSVPSGSSPSDRSPSEYEELSEAFAERSRPACPEDDDHRWPSSISIHDERHPSTHSFVSQISRDSGVVLSYGDESVRGQPTPSVAISGRWEDDLGEWRAELPLRRTIDRDDDQTPYRPFAEFVDRSTTSLLEKMRDERASVVSRGDADSLAAGEDPTYEDLDKFRKDIHKLLGIPVRSEEPPPLPPRKYGRGAVDETTPVRRKDVAKYLGLPTNEYYGTLHRPSATDGSKKRKDIRRYLGISSVASSPLTPSNTPEPMYDSPATRRPSRGSADRDPQPCGRGKAVRTYVRIKPVAPAKPPTKKRSISFVRTRKLSAGQKAGDRNQAPTRGSSLSDVRAAGEAPAHTVPEATVDPEDRGIAHSAEHFESESVYGERDAIPEEVPVDEPPPLSRGSEERRSLERGASPPNQTVGGDVDFEDAPLYENLARLQSTPGAIDDTDRSPRQTVTTSREESQQPDCPDVEANETVDCATPIRENSDDDQYLDMTGTLRRNVTLAILPTARDGVDGGGERSTEGTDVETNSSLARPNSTKESVLPGFDYNHESPPYENGGISARVSNVPYRHGGLEDDRTEHWFGGVDPPPTEPEPVGSVARSRHAPEAILWSDPENVGTEATAFLFEIDSPLYVATDRAMRSKLSSYIDELFEKSMLEYESHPSNSTK